MRHLRYAPPCLLALGALLVSAPAGHGAHISPTVVATIAVGNSPAGVGVNPSTDRVYVATEFGRNVAVIDGASNTVIATVFVGIGAFGVGVNPSTDRVYVADGRNVSVIDGALAESDPANAVVATVPVGDTPLAVGVNPGSGRVYVANRDSDNVSVIDGTTNGVVATVPVGDSPLAVGVNPSTDRIYVANRNSNNVSVIDGASNAVVASVLVGVFPQGIGVNPTTDRIYVANLGSGTVSVIDGASNAVVATVPVGALAWGVGVNPSTDRVYVANFGSDNVSVIEGASNKVVATVSVGEGTFPRGVGVNPTTNRVYVANFESATVSVIADPPLGPIPDPQGDTFGLGPVQLDISSIDAVFGSPLTVTVEFFTPIAPASAIVSNSVVGFIELDTDQNTGTGFPIDSVMGLEFLVDLFSEAGGFVNVFSIDALGNVALEGTAPITFTATSFTVTIPLALIGGDDGRLNYLLLIGTLDEPTDLAPNDPPAISRPADTDADGDGFTDDVEQFVGTDPFLACGPGAWPPDFNDDTRVNLADVFLFRSHFATVDGDPDYDPRFDLNADGRINLSDVFILRQYFATQCLP